MQWIFGSATRDALWLVFPGVFCIAFIYAGAQNYEPFVLALFFASGAVDLGHVYSTAWRTWFNAAELKSSRRYWLLPAVLIALCVLGSQSQSFWFWSALVYFTLFHNIRQFYGILKWYQFLDRSKTQKDRLAVPLLYALTLIPMIGFHFRPNVNFEMYVPNAIWHFPNALLLQMSFVAYALAFVLLTFWVARGIKQRSLRPPIALAVITPTAIYGFAGFVGTNYLECFAPLVLAHGIAYYGLMHLSLQRITRASAQRNGSTWLYIKLIGSLVAGGVIATAFENGLFDSLIQAPGSMTSALLTIIFVVPLLCHYTFDAFIWKHSHREAKIIYQRPPG